MKHTWIVVLMILLLTAAGQAQNRGFGLGIMVGEPTGISFKGWTDRSHAIDGGVAWAFGPYESSMHLHADYLWHSFNVFKTSAEVPLYYGIGGRFKFAHNDDSRFGIRVVVGVEYLPATAPLDVFFEVAPIVDLAPKTEMNGNVDVGARYFFR